jgi:hypothetical protein
MLEECSFLESGILSKDIPLCREENKIRHRWEGNELGALATSCGGGKEQHQLPTKQEQGWRNKTSFT